MYNYLVLDANERYLLVRRYMTHPGIPHDGALISHNTVPLAKILALTDAADEVGTWAFTTDRKLPYILIGTILSIGTP